MTGLPGVVAAETAAGVDVLGLVALAGARLPVDALARGAVAVLAGEDEGAVGDIDGVALGVAGVAATAVVGGRGFGGAATDAVGTWLVDALTLATPVALEALEALAAGARGGVVGRLPAIAALTVPEGAGRDEPPGAVGAALAIDASAVAATDAVDGGKDSTRKAVSSWRAAALSLTANVAVP
jgi:hypothetical protein